MSEPLLRIGNLTMRFGGIVAVDDLSFEAARGDITAIIGPNGAGKTTVFNCITGFYRPTSGRMALHRDGAAAIDLTRLSGHNVAARARIARTFQNIRLFPRMTALENLVVAQHNRLMRASGYTFAGLIGLPSYRRAEDEAIALARDWLERIDLVARADNEAGTLPYGAQRRLEIARAMCTRPVLLCLDEPAAGLNARETTELNELLRDIRARDGVSILLIEHDMSVVMGISDRIIVLDHGKRIATGSPRDVATDPAVVRAYLGEPEEA